MSTYTESYKGMTINIFQDENADGPRDWYNLGTMICFHRRYNLGDSHKYRDATDFFESVARELDEARYSRLESARENGAISEDDYNAAMRDIFNAGTVALPVFLYEHSGITMSTSSGAFRAVDSMGWDWGQVGMIYVTIERAKKEWNKKRVTKQFRARIEKTLRQEVSTYDDYLTGNVYGFDVLDQDGDSLDSCWGFFGDYDNAEYGALTEARRAADYHASNVAAEVSTLQETTYA